MLDKYEVTFKESMEDFIKVTTNEETELMMDFSQIYDFLVIHMLYKRHANHLGTYKSGVKATK